MNTQQLESFLAVAENLNFAMAARILNISQSAVSRQIQSLEEELDVKLFARTSRSVSMTLAGLSFYADAKKIIGTLHFATEKLHRHISSNVYVLNIGCCTEAACHPLSFLLKECRRKFPGIHPHLQVIPHRSILNMFFQGDLDILFSFKDDLTIREGAEYLELFRAPICCTVAGDHPFAGKESISEEELLSEGMVACSSYSISSKAAAIQNRLEQLIPMGCVHYCENLNAMLTLIQAGYGFGILPMIDLVPTPEFSYIPLTENSVTSFGAFYRKNSTDPVLQNFLSVLNV